MKGMEEEIYNVNKTFSEAWNRGDAKALAGFYTEDGVRVGARGDIQCGLGKIEDAYEKLLHGRLSGATVVMEKGTVRPLTHTLALWEGGMEIIPSNGASAIKGYVVQVMKKVRGKWLILESHPKFYPPTESEGVKTFVRDRGTDLAA